MTAALIASFKLFNPAYNITVGDFPYLELRLGCSLRKIRFSLAAWMTLLSYAIVLSFVLKSRFGPFGEAARLRSLTAQIGWFYPSVTDLNGTFLDCER